MSITSDALAGAEHAHYLAGLAVYVAHARLDRAESYSRYGNEALEEAFDLAVSEEARCRVALDHAFWANDADIAAVAEAEDVAYWMSVG